MTTRLQLRSVIRRRLTDTGTDPIWEDDFLNDAVAEAVRRYSTRVPRQAVVAIHMNTGDREVSLPEEVNSLRVVRVFDDRGVLWRRWEGGAGSEPPVPNGATTGHVTWRAWGTELLLATPAPRTGLWRIEHLAHRAEPMDDLTPLDIQPDDEDLLTAQAVAIALERRAIADGKRYTGRAGVHPLAAAARSARIDADRLFFERIRKPRASFFQRTG